MGFHRLVGAGVFASSLALSAFQIEPPPLGAGDTIERPLQAGETHAYRLVLGSGQTVQATIASRPSGARVRLTGPAAFTREMLVGTQGGGARPDSLTVVVDTAGDVRIEIGGAARTGATYSLAIQDVRQASVADRLRAAAEQSYWNAQGIYAKRGAENFRLALTMFEQSLAQWRALGDLWFEGNLLNEIGGIHRLLGQNDEALRYYNQALPVLQASGNLRDQTGTLNNIAAIFYSRGEVRRAFDYFDQSLQLARSTGDRQAQSILLNNIGTLAQAQGDHQRALDLFTQALALRRAVQDRSGEVRTLNNLSLMYRLLGDTQASKESASQALALSDQLSDRQLRAASLNSLGTIERITGELPAAERHLQQALTLFRESGEARLASATLNNLGELHRSQGRLELARSEFEQALAEARRTEERQREAYTLRNIGALAAAGGQHAEAWTSFEQSLVLERAIRNQEGEAESLREMARVRRAQGRTDEALAPSEAGLRLVESLRSRVGNPQLRTTYFSSKRPFYELHVDLLMSGGVTAQGAALEASERAKARSLVDLLRESGVAIREGVDPGLLEREESLRQRINVVEGSRVRELAAKPDAQRLGALERELDALFRGYQQLQSDIRARSPHYAALSQGDAFGIAEIQQALDPDTVLLEYMLGDDRSYVWAVTASSVTGYALPPRANIERLALEVYRRTARYDAARPIGRRGAADAVLRRAKSQLSRLLLEPVAAHLRHRRLVVVADGALLYVPFTLLESPSSPDRPLLTDHEVVHLPSMSSLLAIRRLPPRTRVDQPSVGIIADPVFAADDARVSRQRARAEAPLDPAPRRGALERTAADGGIARFSRLRFTRQEAAGIAALVPAERRVEALDFAANRQVASSEPFRRQTILHFATHAVVNSVHPDLSGLVLSLVDEKGTPQDGFLRLHDIYNLKIDATLVVLSACQTALGQDIRGEGLIGLTRGFMSAGAPRVVASLWEVDDRATAELMKRFYEGMLRRQLAPAAALREAQLALRRDARWWDPYYWGAFVLQGEWR